MLKKLVVTGAAAGLLLVSATAAFASHSHGTSNLAADVSNVVTTSASSGSNTVNGGGSIGTGNASAGGLGLNVVNTSVAGF